MFKKIFHVFIKAIADTIDHDGVEHAGYMAFLMLLSLFPFLVFFVAMVGFIGELHIGIRFINFLLENLPSNLLKALEPRLNEIASGPPQGLLTLAIVGTIWTASSFMEGTRTILNRAYRVGTPPAYILRRLLSIAQFLMLTTVILLAMIALIAAPIIWTKIQPLLGFEVPATSPIWEFMRYGILVLVLFLAVSALYLILPNIKQSWKSVAFGAILVVIGWIISGYAFTYYLTQFNQVTLIYGSLGGVIITLLFFYIISMILIFGAEFNYGIQTVIDHKIETREPAVESPEEDDDAPSA